MSTPHAQPYDRAAVLRRSRREIRRETYLSESARCVGLALAAAGVVVIALRAGAGVTTIDWWWLAAAAAVGLLVAAARTSMVRLDDHALAAVLDSRVDAGGVIMVETPDVRTQDALRAASKLRVSAQRRGEGSMLLIGAALLTGAVLAPVSAAPAPSHRLDLSAQAEEMAAQAEVLADHEAIDQDEAESFAEALEALEDESLATDPWSAWEAMDAARERLEQLAEEGAQRVTERAATGAALNELAKASSDLSSGAMRSLAEGLDAASADPELTASLSPELLDSLASIAGDMTPEDLAAALEALAKAGGAQESDATSALEAMMEAGLLDAEALRDALARANAARAELSEYLEECLCDGEGECDGECSGKAAVVCLRRSTGGVSRGPGATRMAWDDPNADALDAAGAAERLPSPIPDPSGSVRVGSTRASGNDDAGASSSGGALTNADAAASRRSAARVLPRHREAVRRYFEHANREPDAPDHP